LDRGALLLGDALGRVAVAPVLLALGVAGHVVDELRGVAEDVRRRLEDRRGDRVAGPRSLLATVDRGGGSTAIVLRLLGRGAHDARSRFLPPSASMRRSSASRTAPTSFGSSIGWFA